MSDQQQIQSSFNKANFPCSTQYVQMYFLTVDSNSSFSFVEYVANAITFLVKKFTCISVLAKIRKLTTDPTLSADKKKMMSGQM